MMEGMNNMMGFGMGFGWLIWILLIGLIILSVRTVMDAQRKPLGGNGAQERALEILNERFARGEISAEEYENMRQKIMK